MHQDHHGDHQVSTVERKNNIKENAAACGMGETMEHLLMKQRLRWLGHLARMESSHMPKQLLFGEVEKKTPSHGTKRRWRDLVAVDMKKTEMTDGRYDQAQDRTFYADN